MKDAGVEEAEIDRLTSLPPGFERGMIVAVLELGTTRRLTRQVHVDQPRTCTH